MRPEREQYRNSDAAYFVSTQTAGRKPFFRHERWARLMMTTLSHYAEKDFLLHAFVIMPDHLHLLISPDESVEKAVQLIKGGFSFRAKRELEYKFDIWQPGFTDHRVRDEEDWNRHLDYIRTNPIEARLAEDTALYEFMGFPSIAFPQRLKPRLIAEGDVRAEARTLHKGTIPSTTEARTLHEATKSGTAKAVSFQSKNARV
jgi:putative transposase